MTVAEGPTEDGKVMYDSSRNTNADCSEDKEATYGAIKGIYYKPRTKVITLDIQSQ
jgi:hypothetical protein